MYQILLIIFSLTAISLVTCIILQQGKGIGIGTSLSSGASGTLFGSGGANSFMTKIIIILSILFFILSLVLGNVSNNLQENNQWNKLNSSQQINKL